MKEIKTHTKLLAILAFLEGGIVMCIELLGARLIAPIYGSSLEVWSIVLAVSIGALTLGYFAGGFFSSVKKPALLLHILFLLAAGFIFLMPTLASLTVTNFNAETLITNTLIASIAFLFPPLFLLGSTTPIIINLKSDNPNEAGKIAGSIYGISTLGGIFFTYFTGFYLIPKYGLTDTAFIAAVIIGSISFFVLITARFYPAFAVIPLLLVAVFSKSNTTSSANDVTILHYSEGLLGQLLLVDMPKDFVSTATHTRSLFINRIGQTIVDKETGISSWDYPNYLVSLASTLKPNPSVLVLGLGGGTVPRYLNSYVGASVDAVELDKRIGIIAQQYFGLTNTKIIIDDARHYLETNKKKYDLIIFDLYKGESPPSHTLSVEAFIKVKNLLNENGICVINFNGFISGEEGKGGRSLLKTLQEAGFKVKLLPTFGEERYRNGLYIASVHEHSITNPTMALNIKNNPVSLDSLLIPIASINLDDAVILTDDKPLLEKLNTKASKSWRGDYYDNFTKKLTQKGVGTFK